MTAPLIEADSFWTAAMKDFTAAPPSDYNFAKDGALAGPSMPSPFAAASNGLGSPVSPFGGLQQQSQQPQSQQVGWNSGTPLALPASVSMPAQNLIWEPSPGFTTPFQPPPYRMQNPVPQFSYPPQASQPLAAMAMSSNVAPRFSMLQERSSSVTRRAPQQVLSNLPRRMMGTSQTRSLSANARNYGQTIGAGLRGGYSFIAAPPTTPRGRPSVGPISPRGVPLQGRTAGIAQMRSTTPVQFQQRNWVNI